jgi:dTDP-4-dehydrorhamnose reductase
MMRVLVTGASGQLGAYLIDRLLREGHCPVAWSGRTSGTRSGVNLRRVDLADREQVLGALADERPDSIIHLGAISRADAVLREPERARLVNVEATGHLADWARDHRRRFLYISTDLVFDGAHAPYTEEDVPSPTMLYGRTKLDGEGSVGPHGLVVRLPLMFGPSRTGVPSAFDGWLAALRDGKAQTFFLDEYRSPLDYATAADALARLVVGDATGTLHVGGPARVSRFDLMRRVASALGLDASLVLENSRRDVTFPEPRPADVSLASVRLGEVLPGLRRPSVEEAARSWADR